MAKKSKKLKIPKKIAGVKVPKELRKAGKQLVKLAEEPRAREIAFAALAAGLAARKNTRSAAKQAAVDAGDEVASTADWVTAALAAAALEGSRRLLETLDDTDGKSGNLAGIIRAVSTTSAGKPN